MADSRPTMLTVWPKHILMLLALAVAPSYSLRTVYLQPGDGQAFAQAVANFGSTGEDFTIYLPPGRILSLRNATFVDAVPVDKDYRPFSAGTLTIMPAPTTDPNLGPTILDAGMRFGIALSGGQPTFFANTAELRLVNLVVINQCSKYVPLNSQGTMGWDIAGNMHIFFRSRSRRSHTYIKSTMYIPQAELASLLYIPLAFITPFPQFARAAGKVSQDFPRIDGLYKPTSISTYSWFLRYMNQPAASVQNTLYRSLSNPQDTLLASLRASGAIMPQQLCVPDPMSLNPPPSLVDPRAPVWLAPDSQAWLDSVRAAVQVNTQTTSLLGLPPVVILTGAAAPSTLANMDPLPTLEGLLLLTGAPVNDTNGADWPAVLDFGGTTQGMSILPIGQTGDLMIQMMTLQGLATAPLPGAGTLSAFPFTMFPRAPGSPLISLDQITLALPDLDYIAVLTLTQQPSARCAWNDTVSRHTQTLAAGITQITPSQPISQGFAEILLAKFRGWGVNATRIRVVPQNMDVLAQISAACASVGNTYKAAAVAGKGMNSGQEVAALVTGCVVSFVVGALTCYFFVKWRGHSAQGAHMAALSRATEGSTSLGNPSFNQSTPTVLCITEKGGADLASECSPQWLANHPSTSNDLSPTHIDFPHQKRQPSKADPGSQQMQSDPTEAASVPDAQEPAPLGSTMQLSRLHSRALETQDVGALVTFCDGAAVLPGGGDGVGSSLLLALPVGQSLQHHPAGGQAESPAALSFVTEGSLGKTVDTQQAADASAVPAPSFQDRPVQAGSEPSGADAWRNIANIPAAQHNVHQGSCYTHAAGESAALHRSPGPDATATPIDPRHTLTQLMNSIPEDKNMIEIKGFLGQGSGGTVYKASWQGMEVALKTMVFEVTSGDQAELGSGKRRRQDQALMEVAVAARVNHPNLVRTYWYELKRAEPAKTGTASGLQIEDKTRQRTETYKLFLIQELCATSLAQALQDGVFHQGGRIKESCTLPLVLLDIARGLQYLHSINIVHGDLKPENILAKLCSKSHSGVVCKLADFGLVARLPGSATHLSNYTKGTPFYVAPEIISEHKIGRAADIFSFGVVVWQLYSGKTPYMVAGDGSVIWNPAFGHFEPHAMPPPALHQALVRTLQHDPRLRPTAAELVVVLEHVASQPHP